MYKTNLGGITFFIGVICGYNDGMRLPKCGADYASQLHFFANHQLEKVNIAMIWLAEILLTPNPCILHHFCITVLGQYGILDHPMQIPGCRE